jgi:hypothetical protein
MGIIAAGYGSNNAFLIVDERMWLKEVVCRRVPTFSGKDQTVMTVDWVDILVRRGEADSITVSPQLLWVEHTCGMLAQLFFPLTLFSSFLFSQPTSRISPSTPALQTSLGPSFASSPSTVEVEPQIYLLDCSPNVAWPSPSLGLLTSHSHHSIRYREHGVELGSHDAGCS